MGFGIHSQTTMGSMVYRLSDGAGNAIEIRPYLGFNCYRWEAVVDGRELELLYADEKLLGPERRSTRGGIPILFPFPNRIRDGRFNWDGKEYHLPMNESSGLMSIHGFACRHPWRVLDHGSNELSAWLTGEFSSADAEDHADLWPASYSLQITYRLFKGALRLEATVINPDSKPLPFGLGFHPYFKLPFVGDRSPDDATIRVPAKSYWSLDKQSLPTGEKLPVEGVRDLNQPRRFVDLTLDDVLTDLPNDPELDLNGIMKRAEIQSEGHTLSICCSPSFREMVVFTPPHRHAFCVEPYTCATDAVHLQERGVDAGWLTLAPGARWTGVIEMRIQ